MIHRRGRKCLPAIELVKMPVRFQLFNMYVWEPIMYTICSYRVAMARSFYHTIWLIYSKAFVFGKVIGIALMGNWKWGVSYFLQNVFFLFKVPVQIHKKQRAEKHCRTPQNII